MRKIISWVFIALFITSCDNSQSKIASNQRTKIEVETQICERQTNKEECLSQLKKRIYVASQDEMLYKPDQNRW